MHFRCVLASLMWSESLRYVWLVSAFVFSKFIIKLRDVINWGFESCSYNLDLMSPLKRAFLKSNVRQFKVLTVDESSLIVGKGKWMNNWLYSPQFSYGTCLNPNYLPMPSIVHSQHILFYAGCLSKCTSNLATVSHFFFLCACFFSLFLSFF